MIIKLDISAIRLVRPKAETTTKKTVTPLTKEQWITADRIVMATMFIATIAAAIVF